MEYHLSRLHLLYLSECLPWLPKRGTGKPSFLFHGSAEDGDSDYDINFVSEIGTYGDVDEIEGKSFFIHYVIYKISEKRTENKLTFLFLDFSSKL